MVSEEKTEKPSLLKLKQARKKGQVYKSQDIVAIASICGFLLIFSLYNHIYFQIKDFIKHLWQPFGPLDNAEVLAYLREAINLCFFITLPFFLSLFLVVILAHVAQFGFLFSSYPLKIDPKKVNPFLGLKKLFTKDKLVILIKNIIKFIVIIFTLFYALSSMIKEIIFLPHLEINNVALVIQYQAFFLLKSIIGSFLLIAFIDYILQRWIFLKSLKMTKYEVKKEYKDQEGDPILKNSRRQRYDELLEEAEVGIENAFVLITNPTHLAVALSYDKDKEEAPKIIAKAYGEKAKRLREQALKLNICVLRNVVLARDLQWLSINEEIPEHLFEAVAEVLTFVYELNEKSSKDDPSKKCPD